MRCFLLAALLMAALPATAEVPARAFPSVAETGPVREQPQALSHWQKMAEDMAAHAAPSLLSQNVVLAARAHGQASVFDRAFHDFLITALHAHGVPVTAHGYGAHVELDTYPVNFQASRRTARVANPNPNGERYARATPDELAVNLRVFDAGELVFSGSHTYYLPKADLQKYRALYVERTVRHRDATKASRAKDRDGRMHGDYGTRTWGCSPDLQVDCR